jgi:hypothetical protein
MVRVAPHGAANRMAHCAIQRPKEAVRVRCRDKFAGAVAVAFIVVALPVPALAQNPDPPLLDTGFRHLYELKFDTARNEFAAYQRAYPDDALGKATEAASYLFEEFNAKGVFTSAFFLNDKRLLVGADGSPDPARCTAFLAANRRAREMAQQRLKSNSRDAAALLVLTIADGMEADYDALLAKRQIASVSLIRKAEEEGTRLLALDPNAGDAYVALGAGNYIIGSMPAYKRAFLWFGGVHGDRQRGLQQMEEAASRGHYLKPFAKVLLALAYEREHRVDRARALLADLTHEFPENPLFAHELAIATNPAKLCCQVQVQ